MPLFGQKRKHNIIDWRQLTHPNCSSFDERQLGKATTGPIPREDTTSGYCQDSEKMLSKDT